MSSLDLSPATLDLKGIRAGDRNLIAVALTTGGNPLDLTGQTVTAQARKKANDDSAVLDAVVEIDEDPTTGKLTLRWPGEDVRTLLAGQATFNGVWDLQITDGTNDPMTVIAGSFAAVMDVTR